MKKLTNKFTAAILLFWLSMCIWKICSLTGRANILCMVTVSLLDIIGVSIIISNLYQLEEWNYEEWWIHDNNRLTVIGLTTWVPVLCGLIGNVASLSFYDGSFNNVSMVSYVTLQVCYLLNGILTMAISILYTIVLIKTSAKHRNMQNIQYIQQQKWFCSSYIAGAILCQLISAVLLNTGEHKSTPGPNVILNLLYFCMLIYLLISLCTYWKKTRILLSATVSDLDISEDMGRKPHCLKLTRIWVLALMCAVIFGYGAIANYSVEMDFWHMEDNEGGIVLMEYTGQRPNVKIPKQINGQQVIGLDASFSRCDFIKRVSIPQGVTSIGRYAFYGCENMKTISLPDSIKSIEYNAFAFCSSLTELTIPDGVSTIEEVAFYDCSGLKQVVLPKSIEIIGRNAFKYCSGLEEIAFPEGLTVIQEGAFYYCSGLIHVTLPQSLKWIEANAFTRCTSMKTIQLPLGIDYIADNAFEDCDNLESTPPKTSFADREEVIVPEGVTIIREDTFRNCNKLKYVHLPEGLRHIGEGAFAGCASLEEIVIPESVTEIESKTFNECSGLSTVEMLGVRNIKADSFVGCTKLKNIIISDNASFTVQDIIGQKPDEPDEVVAENKTESAVSLLERVPYVRPSRLSSDLLSGQISIGGEVYQFPMHYEDFAADGLMIEADTEEILEPEECRFVDVREGENVFDIVVENIDGCNQPLKSCYVTGVTVFRNQIDNLEIVLPGGLKLQDCSREEIEARYGKPQEIYDDDQAICILTYTIDYSMVVSFRFKKEDMSLTRVRLSYNGG